MTQRIRAFVGMGSNLGERESHLRHAVDALRVGTGIELIATSRVFETDPVGPSPQGPYLNACAEIRCNRSPRELLDLLLAIEAEAGRERASGTRWQARTLDLDLLFYGETCLETAELTIPHPRLHERGFVLEPLCDLAPDLIHPRLGAAIEDLARAVRDTRAVRLCINTVI